MNLQFMVKKECCIWRNKRRGKVVDILKMWCKVLAAKTCRGQTVRLKNSLWSEPVRPALAYLDASSQRAAEKFLGEQP